MVGPVCQCQDMSNVDLKLCIYISSLEWTFLKESQSCWHPTVVFHLFGTHLAMGLNSNVLLVIADNVELYHRHCGV